MGGASDEPDGLMCILRRRVHVSSAITCTSSVFAEATVALVTHAELGHALVDLILKGRDVVDDVSDRHERHEDGTERSRRGDADGPGHHYMKEVYTR